MKITSRLALAAALLLMLRATPPCAGTVQVGLLKASDYDKWLCDASMPLVKPPVEARCASAKFQACSPSCDAIVVTNNSDAPVDVNLKFNGPGFSEEDESGFNFLGECDGPTGERRSYSKPDSCNICFPEKTA